MDNYTLEKIHIVILAGGRIKGYASIFNKGLTMLEGKPAIWYLLKTLSSLKASSIDVVFTPNGEEADQRDQECFEAIRGDFTFKHLDIIWNSLEDSPLAALFEGLQTYKGKLKSPKMDHLLILCGDVPLIQVSDFTGLYKTHVKNENDMTIMCVGRENPFDYGVIYKNEKGYSVFEPKEFDECILKIKKETKDKKYLNRLGSIIKRMEIAKDYSQKRFLNNVGPLIINKKIFQRNDGLQNLLDKIRQDLKPNEKNPNNHYTKIIDYTDVNKIGLYQVSPSEVTTTIGFDSYNEYIGTSARISYLKDKYVRKLTSNFLINQFKDLYKENNYDIDEIISTIRKKEEKGEAKGATVDNIVEICKESSFPPTTFQLFLTSFIIDFQSHKKDLLEIIFDNLRFYQKENNYKIDIIEKLNNFREYEPILYKNKSYRDHLIHVFQVFLLGMYIMKKIKYAEDRESSLGKDLCDNVKCAEMYQIWYYASLYHDICYPVEKAAESMQNLAYKFLVEDIIPERKVGKNKNPFTANISMNQEKDAYYFNSCVYNFVKTSSDLDSNAITLLCGKLTEIFYRSYDHGISSAINFCHLVNNYKPKPKEAEIYYKAILAIALHTIRAIIKINDGDEFFTNEKNMLSDILNNNNLVRLLIFCDNVQEWGRPDSAFFDKQEKNEEEVKLSRIEVDLENKFINVDICCKSGLMQKELEKNKRYLSFLAKSGGGEKEWNYNYEITNN